MGGFAHTFPMGFAIGCGPFRLQKSTISGLEALLRNRKYKVPGVSGIPGLSGSHCIRRVWGLSRGFPEEKKEVKHLGFDRLPL